MKSIKSLVIIFTSILFGLVLAGLVFAHQPRIVSGPAVTEIENPEVSQAFYGKLEASPALYRITSEEPFNLYVGILVPDIEGIDKDFSARVTSDNEMLVLLDGTKHQWTYFYEEYAGDAYYKGPEFKKRVENGIYDIEVFSPDNKGKYVLVVGEKEEFPPGEAIKTLVTLPKLKKDFFEKSPFTALFNRIGLYLLIFTATIVGIIISVVWLLRRKRLKK